MKQQRRLDRLVAQHARRPTKPAATTLVIPNIIDFVTGKDYLNQPKLYPRQALLLKLICLSPELLTAYDHRVLEDWGGGFTAVGEPGARRYAGTEGLPPDVLQRTEVCRREGRRWFAEVVLVLGRRAGKGYLTSLVAAYVLWCFLATGDPQTHFGIDRHKRLSGMFFAGEFNQSRDNLFRDMRQLVSNAPCFAPYVATDFLNRMLICSPADLRRTGRPAAESADEASFVLDARPTTSLAGRGPAAYMVVFDEMAHLGVATARSADEVYEAAVPALDQFDKEALIVQASSPASQQGKFYARYQDALALTDDGIAVNPTLLTVQLPSWAPYEDWELTAQPGGLEMYPGGPPFQPIKRAVINEVGARRREAADPYRFAVERRAQWAVSFRAFLDRDLVDAIFQEPEQTPLVKAGGALDIEYLIHVDPSTNRANYAIVVAHRQRAGHGALPHVVIDEIAVFTPAEFGGRINQTACLERLKSLVAKYAPTSVTFDQHQSALAIEQLRAWVQQQDLPRTPTVSLQTATAPRNARLAEIFQSALGLRLVHSVKHELARLELLHLEVRPDGKVDHPTYGPVQTSDVADCFFEVTEQLIGNAVQPNLGEVLVTGTQAGGLPPAPHWTAPAAKAATFPNFPSASAYRPRPTGRYPARGRWR